MKQNAIPKGSQPVSKRIILKELRIKFNVYFNKYVEVKWGKLKGVLHLTEQDS